jgi:hypothetical protein
LTGGILRHFRALSTPKQNPALEVLSTPTHPQVLITAVVKCRERSIFSRAFPVTSDRKQNLPIEIQLSRQILSFFRMIFFIFRECFAIPVSLSFVPGFRDLSFVDQNNR